MCRRLLLRLVFILITGINLNLIHCQQQQQQAFENLALPEALPGDVPPKVRKPPYEYQDVVCPGVENRPQLLDYNLCGDLNLGIIPLNPMGQHPFGDRYPFEFMRNKTLDYLRLSLPVLTQDPRLPKVSKFNGPLPPPSHPQNLQIRRNRREVDVLDNDTISDINITAIEQSARNAPEFRDFCGDSSNLLCRMWGLISTLSASKPKSNRNGLETNELDPSGVPTPCPSSAHYVTPLFARNFRGLWRYIIQIPNEGYLTQTVEVTQCHNQNCKYMEGSCLSSSRWVSLLAAEIFYPNSAVPQPPPLLPPTTPLPHLDIPMPPVYDFQNFQQYLNTRAGLELESKHQHDQPTKMADDKTTSQCDGVDQRGCFQIRMFHDWFLIPGACKCWKPTNRQVFLPQR